MNTVDPKIRRNRKIGCGALVALFLAFIGIMIFSDRGSPPADKRAVANVRPPADPTRSAKDEFLAAYRDLLQKAEGCDAANKRAMATVQGMAGDKVTPVEAYGDTKDAQDICESASLDIGRISTPDTITGENGTAMSKAIDDCEMAYFLRQRSLETMMAAIDGDTRPSQVQSLKDDTSGAQGGTLQCIAGLWDVGTKLGVTADEFKARE